MNDKCKNPCCEQFGDIQWDSLGKVFKICAADGYYTGALRLCPNCIAKLCRVLGDAYNDQKVKVKECQN